MLFLCRSPCPQITLLALQKPSSLGQTPQKQIMICPSNMCKSSDWVVVSVGGEEVWAEMTMISATIKSDSAIGCPGAALMSWWLDEWDFFCSENQPSCRELGNRNKKGEPWKWQKEFLCRSASSHRWKTRHWPQRHLTFFNKPNQTLDELLKLLNLRALLELY